MMKCLKTLGKDTKNLYTEQFKYLKKHWKFAAGVSVCSVLLTYYGPNITNYIYNKLQETNKEKGE